MNGPKKHMAEEMIGRFRFKEDLYRYMTQQGKTCLSQLIFIQ
jgi:hypothetical protein